MNDNDQEISLRDLEELLIYMAIQEEYYKIPLFLRISGQIYYRAESLILGVRNIAFKR